MSRIGRQTKRMVVGFIGWAVLLVGVVLIPFPGPGWVIVFIGFSILASEFDWAKESREWVRERYEEWQKWYMAQSPYIQLAFGLLSLATAVVIVWLTNGYGIINDWLHLNQPWLNSPFVK